MLLNESELRGGGEGGSEGILGITRFSGGAWGNQ